MLVRYPAAHRMSQRRQHPLGYETRTPEPKRGRRLFGWIIAAAAALVMAGGTVAFYALHWHPVIVFWLVFFGLMIVAVPAGILYGTQDKDYWP